MLFQGTFHLLDDTSELEATFEVAAGRVTISSGGQEIGRWPAKKIDLTHRRDGILLTVDGESLVVRPIDRYGFSDAVEAATDEAPKRRFLRRRQKPVKKPTVNATVAPPAYPDRVPAQPAAKSRRSAPLPPVEPPQPSAWPFDGHENRTSDRTGPAVGPETSPLADAIESAKANPLPGRFVEASTPVPIDLTKEIFGEAASIEPSARKPGVASRLAERWRSIPAGARRAGVAVAVGALLTLLIPEVVATVLVLTGLAACLAGGAGMADPSYTRKLPAALSDSRLLIGGGVMLVVGFLIGLPSL